MCRQQRRGVHRRGSCIKASKRQGAASNDLLNMCEGKNGHVATSAGETKIREKRPPAQTQEQTTSDYLKSNSPLICLESSFKLDKISKFSSNFCKNQASTFKFRRSDIITRSAPGYCTLTRIENGRRTCYCASTEVYSTNRVNIVCFPPRHCEMLGNCHLFLRGLRHSTLKTNNDWRKKKGIVCFLCIHGLQEMIPPVQIFDDLRGVRQRWPEICRH